MLINSYNIFSLFEHSSLLKLNSKCTFNEPSCDDYWYKSRCSTYPWKFCIIKVPSRRIFFYRENHNKNMKKCQFLHFQQNTIMTLLQTLSKDAFADPKHCLSRNLFSCIFYLPRLFVCERFNWGIGSISQQKWAVTPQAEAVSIKLSLAARERWSYCEPNSHGFHLWSIYSHTGQFLFWHRWI